MMGEVEATLWAADTCLVMGRRRPTVHPIRPNRTAPSAIRKDTRKPRTFTTTASGSGTIKDATTPASTSTTLGNTAALQEVSADTFGISPEAVPAAFGSAASIS